MYRIYPTLVEQYMNYKLDLYDITWEDIINKINRVPEPKSEAAQKGSSFHELTVYDWTQLIPAEHRGQMCYFYDDYRFPAGPVEEIGKIRQGGEHEVYVEKELETKFGPVLLYGFIDTIKDGVAYDIKTTSRYDIGKYLRSLQRSAYLWMSGSRQFQFLVTNFHAVFKEDYYPTGKEEERIRVEVEDFLEFCSHFSDHITDSKFLGR
jgi:hypothetical protein